MNHSLWEQLRRFDFDENITPYGFATRLAYENEWTLGFTHSAILEYKKFLFLAAISDEMVSPSPMVDIVWHQHLLFTRSYDQCCGLLGKKIAHIPSTHNKSEEHVFVRARDYTRQLYEFHFGQQPAAFWQKNSFREVLNIETSKVSIRSIVWIGILVFLLMIPVSLYLLVPVYTRLNNPWFLVSYAVLASGIFILLNRYNRRQEHLFSAHLVNHPILSRLTPLELVYMSSLQNEPVIRSVAGSLFEQEALSMDAEGGISLNKPLKTNNALEYIVLETVEEKEVVSYTQLVSLLQYEKAFIAIKQPLTAITNSLKRSATMARIFVVSYSLLLLLLLPGVTRFITGIERQRPVLFLGIILIILTIASFFYLNRIIHSFVSETIPRLYKEVIIPSGETEIYQSWDWRYFMLGSAILPVAFIHDMQTQPSSTDSYSSCGSSDSSDSSCGSGGDSGGGCGGCGGGD